MSQRFKVHIKIINIWLAIIAAMVLFANIPHLSFPWESWLNYALYVLLFLLCVFIARKEPHNKAIFVNLAIVCFILGFSFLNTYIGPNYLFGDLDLMSAVFQYRSMAVAFFLALSVVYLCVRYVCLDYPVLVSYSLSIVMILPFFLWYFLPYLMDPRYLGTLDSGWIPFFKDLLKFTFLPLFFLFLYGALLYRNERSMGEHINTLAVCFLIMLAVNIVQYMSMIYGVQIFEVGQRILMITLAFFTVTLLAKLHYIYSDFGVLYDRLLVGKKDFGIKIKRRRNRLLATLLGLAKSYIHERKHIVGLFTLMLVVMVNFLKLSTYVRIHLIVFLGVVCMLLLYLLALQSKRAEKNHLIVANSTTPQDT
jgi:hypothetical protein